MEEVKKTASQKAKEKRLESKVESARLEEATTITFSTKRRIDEKLSRKLEDIGMTKDTFIRGCIHSYLCGQFKFLDGEVFFVRDTHTLSEIGRVYR